MNDYEEETKRIYEVAKEYGVEVIDKGKGHFQIKGKLLVNYYPFSRNSTAYIAGTRHGIPRLLLKDVMKLALNPPPVRKFKGKRKSQKRRKVALLRRSDKCHWCKVKLTLETATIDHVIPLYRGGLDNANNIVLACDPCNKERGHEMPEVTGTKSGRFKASDPNLSNVEKTNG